MECRGDGVGGGRHEKRGTDHGATTQEVRQNVREGCEFAVASANDALDEAKTELSRLANDGAPTDATSVGAGLARNIATLVDARAAAVSDVKVARVASALRAEAAETSQRHAESAHEERTKRDDAHNALSDEVRRVEERCSAAVDAARNDAETALAAATLKYQSDAEQRANTSKKETAHAVKRCAAEAKQAADDAREATERVVLAAVAEARRAAERDAERLSREVRAVDARGAAAAAAAVDGCRQVAGESATHAVEAARSATVDDARR